MAVNYGRARATAARLISNAGQPAQVIKKGKAGGTMNAEGDISPAIPDIVIDGIAAPIFDYKAHEIDGTSIQYGDGWAFFHSEIEPEINMQITVNSKTLRIVGIDKLDSIDGINVYRILQLRK